MGLPIRLSSVPGIDQVTLTKKEKGGVKCGT